jgi:predicted nucleotidyltransferase
MDEVFIKGLREWAEANGNVKELWLFGSHAKGTSRFESDVDIAVALIPPQGKHNWAYGNYVVQQPQWKEQLETIVSCKVDLCMIEPGTSLDVEVRMTGKVIWPIILSPAR